MNTAGDKTWWQRNRVAVLVVFLVVGGMALVGGGIVYGVFSMIKSSDAYAMALAAARADPRVAEQLGTPIETGLLTTGNIRVQSGGSGSADLAIPLSGPKASGKLLVVARRSAGEWKLLRLVLEAEDGKRTELIAAPGATAEPAAGN